MTLAASSIAAGQLADALTQVRMSRHHRDCRCGSFRGLRNAPYCRPEEQRWSYQLDRLLETVLRQSF